MSKGTSSGLLDTPKAQSVFKHAILKRYVIPFAVMTASKIPDRRAVLLDGFAGRGRYDDGRPASAEHLLMAAEKTSSSTNVEVFLVERNKSDYELLTAVADEYRHCGVKATTRHGVVQDHLPEVLAQASEAPLFLFLDPCGANLPFATLTKILGQDRRNEWPRTEALLNISAELIRRAAGAVAKGLADHDSVPVLNAMCGGDWWQETALRAHATSPTPDWESAADAVVDEYTDRLAKACRMKTVVAPVRRKTHHQPVYYLVFFTRKNHGLWVFGDAVAEARHRWLEFLGPSDEEVEGMLFNMVESQIEAETEAALRKIKQNLLDLATRGCRQKLVDHTEAVFDGFYGTALEKTVRTAMRELQREGVRVDTTPRQVRDWLIG
ncbi:three-Cys-motif partner protein TcmP [Lentzea sp. BCCO 10_0856]|uniref:Three-Cys-motif partner protein TcmP n=1 Tax=Lentzea miocenica TaxID=3095431 RepID=A0ABU4TFB7_9PSEU|nr:three-Cys-motif partner protein TcmP [Lentzea sp. BCCO 10_0856]MDX8036578.1 three-Cys-motif partner protein TcmP [Lentzea sp. BCCO 10_0856]